MEILLYNIKRAQEAIFSSFEVKSRRYNECEISNTLRKGDDNNTKTRRRRETVLGLFSR